MNGFGGMSNAPIMRRAVALHPVFPLSIALIAVSIVGCQSEPQAKAPPRDPVALEAYAKACTESSDPDACLTACNAGVYASCNELGHLYELGMNVPSDGVAASSYYRKACDGGDMQGCYSAAYVLENGIAGRRDAHCALALYAYSCDGGYLRACIVGGYMLKTGVDLDKDEARAAVLFKKACDGGKAEACNQLKELGQPQP